MLQENLSAEAVQQMATSLNEEAAGFIESNPHLALEKAKEAERLSKHPALGEKGYVEGRIRSLINKANAFFMMSEYAEGLQTALAAHQQVKQNCPTSALHLDVLRVVGHTYCALGDYPKAMSFYHEMLLIAEQLDDVRGAMVAHNGLGIVYQDTGNNEEAINQYQYCLEYGSEEEGVTLYDRLGFKTNLCSVYIDSGQPQSAIPLALEALHEMKQHDVDNVMIHVALLGTLGEAYSELGQYEEAELYYEQIHPIIDHVPSKPVVVSVHFAHASFLLKCGRLEEAQQLTEKAIGATADSEQKQISLQYHELSAQIAEVKGDFEQAYHHHKQFHAIQAKLRSKENGDRIRFLRISHEIDVAQKEAEIYRLETVNAFKSLEQAEEIDALRSNMIRTILHEFRTPLTVISNSFSLLNRHSDKMSADKQMKYQTYIEEAIQYLTHLLREVDKIENTAIRNRQPTLSFTSVGEWGQELVTFLRMKTGEPANVTYLFDAADETPIQIDMDMTKMIVLELVTNGIKYTPDDKPITVEMGVDGDNLVITVADEGVGIAANEIDKIHELFYRAYKAGDVPGLGTGLYVVMAMVTVLNGEIGVESAGEGLGSTFSLKIPRLPVL